MTTIPTAFVRTRSATTVRAQIQALHAAADDYRRRYSLEPRTAHAYHLQAQALEERHTALADAYHRCAWTTGPAGLDRTWWDGAMRPWASELEEVLYECPREGDAVLVALSRAAHHLRTAREMGSRTYFRLYVRSLAAAEALSERS